MTARAVLAERRILVVDGNHLVAQCLARDLQRAGAAVLGPVPSVAEALHLIEAGPLDGAMLDVDMRGETAFSVADALAARGVPFVFLTGSGAAPPPERHAAAPRRDKQARVDTLGAALFAGRTTSGPEPDP